MKRPVRTLAPVLITFFAVAGAQCLNAQIMDAIHARVDHSFVSATRPYRLVSIHSKYRQIRISH
jgi:hypothetical protein